MHGKEMIFNQIVRRFLVFFLKKKTIVFSFLISSIKIYVEIISELKKFNGKIIVFQ